METEWQADSRPAPEGSLRAARARAAGSELTVCVMTAGPAGRLSAILSLLRPVASELLVAIDDRAAPAVVSALGGIADTLILYPYADPVDRPLAWLHGEASGDWVLSLDDDEIPSARLLDALPELLADEQVTHYWLPRRWLFPDASRHLDEQPWRPDYQLRLVRNDDRFLRFSNEFHRPIVALGPGRFPDAPLWHADPLLRSPETRFAKARKYEQQRPGMRIAGRALNYAFYVPELRADARTAPLPPAERELVESVLSARDGDVFVPFRPTLRRATRAEIDARWPGRPLDETAYRVRLELLERPETVTAGERRTVDVLVANRGGERWEWGKDGEPAIRLASRWRNASGEVDGEPLRTHFPATLEAGGTDIVPVHVAAPAVPGRYRLELDLVHEHVRWFGCDVACEVEVVRARRIGVVGGGEELERVAELLTVVPELEPVVVEPDAEPEAPTGYERLPGLRAYLFDGVDDSKARLAGALSVRTAALLLAARRIREGREPKPLPRGAERFLAELAACEAVVVAGVGAPPGAPPSRELWRLGATVLAADTLGVPVLVADSVLQRFDDPADRALAQLIRRTAHATFERPLDLAPLLAEPLRTAHPTGGA